MMAIVGFQLLDRHSQPARCFPQIDTSLHEPGRSGVSERMPHNVLAQPRIFQNSFPGRPDLAGKRPAILRAVDNKPDGFAVVHDPGRAQLSRSSMIDHAPANQVRPQPVGDFCRRAPFLG